MSDTAAASGIVTKRQIGTVSVDSGQVLIIDPCNAPDVDYEACCALTLGDAEFSDDEAANEKLSRKSGFGTVSPTAYGDGIYPVYAIERNGQLLGLEVRFDLN